jgi:TolA-binding protein
MEPSHHPDEPRILEDLSDPAWDQYKFHILGAVALVILILVGLVWFWHAENTKALAAMEQFSTAETAEEWQAVVTEFPKTPAAALAMIKIANQAQGEKRFTDASATYREFLTQFPKHPIAPAAQFALGRSYQASGQTDQAVQIFESILSAKPQHPFFGGASVSLAEILISRNENERAKQILTTLFSNDTKSSFQSSARTLLSQITSEP